MNNGKITIAHLFAKFIFIGDNRRRWILKIVEEKQKSIIATNNLQRLTITVERFLITNFLTDAVGKRLTGVVDLAMSLAFGLFSSRVGGILILGSGVVDVGFPGFLPKGAAGVEKRGENAPVVDAAIVVGVLDFAGRDSSTFKSMAKGSYLAAGGITKFG